MGLKYKKDDIVYIKDEEWYERNKDKFGAVFCDNVFFVLGMTPYLGKLAIITDIIKSYGRYRINLDNGSYVWTDSMFENEKFNELWD